MIMTKEQAKYYPQTKEELRSLIEQRIEIEGNEVNLNDIDVSAITDMSKLFMNMENFNADISEWDVSNVTDMLFMFFGCQSFNQDLSEWNVLNVTDASNVFYNCPIKEEYKPKFK